MERGDLIGAWRLSRRVRPDQGPMARLDGEARVAPEAGGLRYREAGLLRLPGHAPMTAGRSYLWRVVPGGIAVAFEDGRPFHVIDIAQARPEACHQCGADHYAVRYDLAGWPRWSSRWRVEGPRKAYTMVSRYAPLAGGEAIGHPAGDAVGAPSSRSDAHDP